MNQRQSDEVSVRDAVNLDIECLVQFNLAMALETEGRQLDQSRLRTGLQSLFEDPSRGFYIVAEVQQETGPKIVGQLLVTFEWSDWRNANFWWIQSVYVHQDWRNRGVFRALYQRVHGQAQARTDVCGLRLYVERENATALAVYAKMGMVSTPYRLLEQDFVLPVKLADSKDVP